MARSWSRRARRDFDERRNDEKDRYEKRDKGETAERREEDAREDRREERGYEYGDWSRDDFEAALMQIRNASPDDDVNEVLDRLRERYDYYESELDRYDADYDDLMAEVDRLKRDNRRYMMRDAREEGREATDRQDKDIRQDNDAEKSFDDLWKEREG